MDETFFEELQRYVQFGPDDQEALRRFRPVVEPHFWTIAEEFYDRLAGHDQARQVFEGPAQIERLKGSLQTWMSLLFSGPWDQAYYELRARIGRRHVEIDLPQRYMFGAMDVIRVSFARIANQFFEKDPVARAQVVAALHKILDLELAIMLETYREAFIDKIQMIERVEKAELQYRLAMTEARYDEVVERGEALVTTMSPRGRILLFNAKCERVTGLSRAEAGGRSWLDLFAAADERARIGAGLQEAAAGRPAPAFEGEVQAVGAGGRRRIRWRFTTLPGGAGPILCAMGLDVTEEHELAVRTRRAERLASLGTMAAGLAHEIRNPLNAAHLQLSVARRRLLRAGGEPSTLQAVELADSEMTRLAGLVEEFLRFARPQPLRLAVADLRSTAEVTVSLVEPEARSHGVAVELAPGTAVMAEFDDEKLKQVMLNLLRNGVEAAGQGGRAGRVEVAIESRGGQARLTIADDGPGIPADAPIFEPFFTTKEQGTGLGLAIVHRIVIDHGGTVEVDSRPGRTVFAVVLPESRGGGAASGHVARPLP